jgi:hypothetical protein
LTPQASPHPALLALTLPHPAWLFRTDCFGLILLFLVEIRFFQLQLVLIIRLPWCNIKIS